MNSIVKYISLTGFKKCKMKKTTIIALLFVLPFLYVACGGNENDNSQSVTPADDLVAEEQVEEEYDPTRGHGEYDEDDFDNLKGLDAALAEKGKAISTSKCFSCHKANDEMLVGPGWKGVTERRTLHWIMNFISNPDPMIDKDPELQKQLEQCLVRMPNQFLDHDDARAIVEYMRENDGVK